jgi:hypothetical protein
MADVIAHHVIARDVNGQLASDSYVKPEELRNTVRLLTQEYLTVKIEDLTELPEGVELD